MLIDLVKIGSKCTLPTSEAGKVGVGDFDSYGILQDNITNATYIPFMPNGINSCRFVNPQREILSYNFSGCLFVVWEDQGDFFAGHVSTGEGQDCKKRWDAAKDNFTRYAEFCPHKYIVRRDGVVIPQVYGVVSLTNGGNGLCFSTIGIALDKAGNRTVDQWHMFDVEWGRKV